IAVELRVLGRALAHDEAAHHLGGAVDLRVALPVAEVVAVHAALGAVAVRALAASGERVTGLTIAIDVVADALPVTQASTVVRGAFPPSRHVRAVGACVLAALDLAAECRVPVQTKAGATVAGPNDRPRRTRPHEIADRCHREGRACHSRLGQRAAPGGAALQQRSDRGGEALGEAHRALQAAHASGSSVYAITVAYAAPMIPSRVIEATSGACPTIQPRSCGCQMTAATATSARAALRSAPMVVAGTSFSPKHPHVARRRASARLRTANAA